MTASGWLQAGRFPVRLMAFLKRAPDEFLTIDDAAEKFDVRRDAVREAVRRLRRQGVLGPGPFIELPKPPKDETA